MKRGTFLFVVITLLIFTLQGCDNLIDSMEEHSDRTTIYGSGNLVKLELDYTGFDMLSLSHTFKAAVTKGQEYSVTLTVDNNIEQYIEVYQIAGKLYFGLDSDMEIDSVIVYWPSGIVQEIGALEVNQHITIVEDESVGIGNNEIITCYAPSSVIPNPISNIGTLVFSQNNKGVVDISLINSTGSIIKKLSNKVMEKGSHEIEIDVCGLQSGIYFVKIITSSNTEVIRIVVM